MRSSREVSRPLTVDLGPGNVLLLLPWPWGPVLGALDPTASPGQMGEWVQSASHTHTQASWGCRAWCLRAGRTD